MHREILEDTHGAELSIHLDFDEMRAECSAYFTVQRRIRRGRSDEYAFPRRQSFLGDLALECIGRLSHRISSLDCGAAARFPDGVWATVGIAPYHFNFGQWYVQRFGGDHGHGCFRAGADIRDANEHRVLSFRIQTNDGVAAAQSGSECHKRDTGASFDWPWIRAGLRTPTFLPLERFRSTMDTFFQRVVGVRHFVARLAGHVLQDEFDGIHL